MHNYYIRFFAFALFGLRKKKQKDATTQKPSFKLEGFRERRDNRLLLLEEFGE
jgi:hypothetical protein